MKIFETIFTLRKSKETIQIKGVIVTGNDKDELMNDDFYFKRAIRLIGVKASESAKYKVIDIVFIKQIGETND